MAEERTPLIGSIVVGSDLSAASDRIIRDAAGIARFGRAELHVVSAYAIPNPAIRDGPGPELPREVLDEVERALPAQLRRIIPDDWPASAEVRFGPAAEVILQRAREVHAGLIVLGPHRGRDVHARFLGTTADEVLRRSEVPCLALRGALTLPICTIGVATDFSATANRAVRCALSWAHWLGSGAAEPERRTRFYIVHVLPSNAEEHMPDLQRQLGETLQQARDEEQGALELEKRSDLIVANDIAAALTRWAAHCELDLLVIGTHGQSGFQRPVLGSISATLARSSPCPILLVPRGDRAEREENS